MTPKQFWVKQIPRSKTNKQTNKQSQTFLDTPRMQLTG